jgi:hypothetical protein
MLHIVEWLAIGLLGLFFFLGGVLMLVAPRTYFRWLGRVLPPSRRLSDTAGGTKLLAIELWTRVRGAILLGVMAWVAYQGYLKIR